MARRAKAKGSGEARLLTAEDIARLDAPRPKRALVTRFRERHQVMARLIASGVPPVKVAVVLGMSLNRVSMFANDPAFQELVATYRSDAELMNTVLGPLDQYSSLAQGNMILAEQLVRDRLEDAEANPEESPIPLKELLQISRDAADRFGFGKHHYQTNANLDFAALLDAAVKRSNAVIEATPVTQPGQGVTPSPDRAFSLPHAVEDNLLAPPLHVIDGDVLAVEAAQPTPPPPDKGAGPLPVSVQSLRRRV